MKKYLKGKWGIASIVFGALMFALAFVPYSYSKMGAITYAQNMYNGLANLFNYGFGGGFGSILAQVGFILYFLAAIYAIVMGILILVKVIKAEKLDLIGYATGFGATLFVFIGALIVGIPAGNTLLYITLVIIGAVLGYKLFEMLKK